MILSRTMRPADYQELQPEVQHLNRTIELCGPVPYMHRVWEYALILRAMDTVYGTVFSGLKEKPKLTVADYGCSDGLSPAMMLREGCDVSLYELWDSAYGDKKPDAVNKANIASRAGGSSYQLIDKPLGKLDDSDKNRYDIALCISVIEHIPNEEECFNDILDSVKEHGLVIVTMDFHPSGVDNLFYNWLRSRIYDKNKMESLQVRAEAKGFKLLGGEADWSWSPDMIMVQNEYGFSSIVLVR